MRTCPSRSINRQHRLLLISALLKGLLVCVLSTAAPVSAMATSVIWRDAATGRVLTTWVTAQRIRVEVTNVPSGNTVELRQLNGATGDRGIRIAGGGAPSWTYTYQADPYPWRWLGPVAYSVLVRDRYGNEYPVATLWRRPY